MVKFALDLVTAFNWYQVTGLFYQHGHKNRAQQHSELD